MQAYLSLKKVFERFYHLQYLSRILMWDEAVMMPQKAGQFRAQAVGTLHRLEQKLLASKKVANLLNNVDEASLNDWDKANLDWMRKLYVRAACIPLKLAEEVTKAALGSEIAWRKFRAQNDWQAFLPYFTKTFSLVSEIAERRSQALQIAPYDVLLDEYVPNFSQELINPIFEKLTIVLPALMQQVVEKQKLETVYPLSGTFPIEEQRQLGLEVMKALGFDFQYGRLDVSHHPFCSGGPRDVRITTRYKETEFLSALMGICHETGHALYEQGLPQKWLNQPVGHIHSMAMHESQSLFVEMEITRSQAFYQFIAPLIQKRFGEDKSLQAGNLYKMVTRVRPSLIRVDADEVTYPLHVILRYELEKKLFNKEINLSDLPSYWDEMMQKWLGLSTKETHQNGVMQDVHWAAGAFGYFPAYTLGRLIAAQIYMVFEKQHPNLEQEIAKGNIKLVQDWLNKNVYQNASKLDTDTWLKQMTGKSLGIEDFVTRIKTRYLA